MISTLRHAIIFYVGQHQKLESLHPEKKMMWKQEINCLLSVCDSSLNLSQCHIVYRTEKPWR
ncbi:putative PRONE domain, Rop guanine nucleotide exchange factor [Helianthus anomalus]